MAEKYRCGRCGKKQAPSPAELCPSCAEASRKLKKALARAFEERRKRKKQP